MPVVFKHGACGRKQGEVVHIGTLTTLQQSATRLTGWQHAWLPSCLVL